MSNSTIELLVSLRSLLDGAAFQSDKGALALDILETAKQHSNQLGLVIFGLLTARCIYPVFKRSTAFRQLDGPKPESVLWGGEPLLFRVETSLTAREELLNTYGSVCKIKGMLGEDRLWVADPRALNEIVQKAYDSFHEAEIFLAWHRLALGNYLTTHHGKSTLPASIVNLAQFSTQYLPPIICVNTPTFTAIAHQLEDIIASKAQANGGTFGTVDIHTWLSKVSLEMIGQAGMGYSFGAMDGKQHPYLKASNQLFPGCAAPPAPAHNALFWFLRPFLPTLVKFGPAGFRRAVVDCLPVEKVQELKNITDTMDTTAVHIYQKKKVALANGTLESEIAAGQDVISMLLKQNEVVPPEEQMTEEEIIAHVNALVNAGNDTTSSALEQIFYLLAQHPDVQDRLHEEIREAHRLYGRDLDYDQLNSLTLLDAVCRESLRLLPPAHMVERVACVDYNLPLHHPVKSKDGKTIISNLHVPKGTHIYLSLFSANRDKQTWGEDADKFNPYRWLEPMVTSVSESKMPGVYSNIMTFVGGPRACLGFKFSLAEIKVVLSLLLRFAKWFAKRALGF
ncbi:cytochrome P450 family protein, partial [Rhizoctonia solani AG-3 Rhs1AP]